MPSNPQQSTAVFLPRLALFYATLFCGRGYPPAVLSGLACRQGARCRSAIGLVLAAPMIVRIAAVPLATREADRRGALRPALVIASFAAAAGMALVGLAEGAAAILIVFTLASIAWAPVMPLTDAYALKGIEPHILWPGAPVGLGCLHRGQYRRRVARRYDRRAASDLDDRGSNGRDRCCRAGVAAGSSRRTPGQSQATGRSAVHPGLHRGGRGVEPRAGEPCGLLRLLRDRLESGWPRRHDDRRAVGARGAGRDRAVCVCGPAACGDQSDHAAGHRRRRGGHPLDRHGVRSADRPPCRSSNACTACRSGRPISAPWDSSRGPRRRSSPPPRRALLPPPTEFVMAAATGSAGLLYGSHGSMAYGAMVLPAAAGGLCALAAHRLMRRGLAG